MLSRALSPIVALSAILITSLLSACDPKDNSSIPEAGSIRITWSKAGADFIKASAIKVSYGKVDPIAPIALSVSQPAKEDQAVPTGIMFKGQAITLQSIELMDASRSLWRIERPELDGLRSTASNFLQPSIQLESAEGQPEKISVAVSLPGEQYWELPARTSERTIKSLIPVALDLFRLDDIQDSLLKLRWVSSTSEKFTDELSALVTLAPALDLSRLELLLDSFYFPTSLVETMRKRERALLDSNNPADLEMARVIRENISVAETQAELSNRLVFAGMLKISTMNFDDGFRLLSRLFPGKDGTDIAFQQLINKLGGSFEGLLNNQKVQLLDLAVKKKALAFAASLAGEIFLKGQDKSIGALLDLTRRFPPGPERDQLSQAAAQVIGEISVAELAALITPIQSREILLQTAESLLTKVKDLTTQQVITLTEQRSPDEIRDTLMLMALRQTTKFDPDSIRALLLMATNWTVRGQMCALVLPKISPLLGKSFANLIQVLPAEVARDELLFQGLALMSSLTPNDYASLADVVVGDRSFWDFLEQATPRLTPFRMSEAVATSDLLLGRPAPYRDAFLIKAAQGVTDLAWDTLDDLLIRASTDGVKDQIREIARKRLGN